MDKKRKLDENGKEIRRALAVVGDVTVYAPTLEQEEVLMNFVETHINKENNKVEITGEEVFRVLYKELTDLQDIDKVSDEELKEIIEHPDEDLEEINNILSNELFKISKKIINAQKQMAQTINTLISSEKLKNNIESMSKGIKKENPKVSLI
jgi:vacuolar-type H+-ATPase subunit I/STV1